MLFSVAHEEQNIIINEKNNKLKDLKYFITLSPLKNEQSHLILNQAAMFKLDYEIEQFLGLVTLHEPVPLPLVDLKYSLYEELFFPRL